MITLLYVMYFDIASLKGSNLVGGVPLNAYLCYFYNKVIKSYGLF